MARVDDHIWDADVHRAMASSARTRIMALLQADGQRFDISELSHELGLHANTVRSHLAVLEDAGLVASTTQPQEGPGRPRHIYHATAQSDQLVDGSAYRFLARMLADLISDTSKNPSRTAEATGSAWGRGLVDAPGPDDAMSAREGIDRVVEVLDELGFAPAIDDHDPTSVRLLLRRCPFLDIARDHQAIVCSIHLGLMRGALDVLDVEVVVDALEPLVEPSLCVSRLTVGA